MRAAEKRLAHSRRARWSSTCVCSLAAWLAVAGDPPPRLLPCQLRFASCDPLLFAPAGPGAGTVPLPPPVPPSWVSPPSPLLRAALAAPAGTRGVPPTWWAGKKGVPPTRWVLARGALPLFLSGRLPAAPAGEGNANPSISGSKPPPQRRGSGIAGQSPASMGGGEFGAAAEAEAAGAAAPGKAVHPKSQVSGDCKRANVHGYLSVSGSNRWSC